MKVGLFGGSFDPIHRGHLALANAALKQHRLDRVYFVLSRQSPLKEKSSTPVQDRLAMLRLAIRRYNRFFPATWELQRGGPSYTIQTLRDYRKHHPTHDVYWIMGSDSLKEFYHWREPHQILKIAQLIVGRRPGAMKSFGPEIINFDIGRIALLKGAFPDISSTEIRRSLSRGRKAWSLIPSPVRSYILKRKLYGVK